MRNRGFTPDLDDAKKESKEASWADRSKEYYQMLSDARTLLLMNHIFFGRLAMKLKFVLTDKIPTAAIRADAVCMFNPHFLEQLDVSERAFVVAHEICHLMYLHFDRVGERDHRMWNHAGDYVINYMLVESGMKMPERPNLKLLYDKKYKDYSSEQIYDLLKEDQEKQKQQQGQGQGQGQGGQGDDDQQSQGGGQGEDGDEQDEQSQGGGGQGEEGDEQGQGGQGQDQPQDGQQQGPSGGGFGTDFGDCDFGSTRDLKDRSDRGDGERVMSPREWQDEVVNAAVAAKRQGSLPAGIERFIEEIQEPQLPWNAILSRTVSQALKKGSSFRNPSRRTPVLRRMVAKRGKRTILPGPKPDRRPIVVALDTSGSMSEEDLTNSLSEVAQILKVYNRPIRVMACDADVHVDEDIRDVRELPIRGGGGTSTEPVFRKIEDEPGTYGKPAMLIYFSDLYAHFPEERPPFPVVWVQTDGTEPRKVPWGTVVLYENKQVHHQNLESGDSLKERLAGLLPPENEVEEPTRKASGRSR